MLGERWEFPGGDRGAGIRGGMRAQVTPLSL